MATLRIETLSDQAGDQLRETVAKGRKARTEASAAETAVDQARTSLDHARRSRPLWRRVIGLRSGAERQARLRLQEASDALDRSRTEAERLDQRRQQQHAGVTGEDELIDRLTSLSDDWTAYRGYVNRRGEADAVLVGPTGVWAIEVKYQNIHLKVDGDRWIKERIRNGVRTEEAATDASDRTWARQVADVAERLQWWLDKNGQPIPVRSAVVITHPKATVKVRGQAEVDYVGTDIGDLLTRIRRQPDVLDAATRHTVGTLIARDHRHHEQQRTRPGGSGRRRGGRRRR